MKLIDLTRINQLIDDLLDKINEKYTTKAELSSGLKGKADASHGTHLTLGTGSGNAFRGDYGNTAYNHSKAAHAPSNAQKNSDITKAEIEAKLTGDITTHKHTVLESNDTRSKNALPSTYTNRGIVPEFKSSATIGLPEVGKGFTGLITYQQWSDTSAWSGGKATQFGTIDDGRMYYRKGDGSGWGTWYQFYTTQNKPTPADIGAAKANHGTHVSYGGNGSAATVSRSDHTHSYLPLSGGTMTNNVSYQFTGTGGHAIGLAWKNNDTNKTTFGGIGALANAGTGSSLYIGWGSEPWVASNNLQVSSSGIKYKNNKIYHAGDKPTPDDIGAAKASHGTHVTYDSTAPKANGAATAGSSSKVARADHVHPLQTSVSGNAGSANKVNNALSIQLNGGTATSFDGSAAKSINITPASIGAAASHNHDTYVNKNAFANIKVGKTTVAADAVQDTVELVAGTNVTLTPDATNDKITITAKDTVYTHPAYTAKSSGFYKVTVDDKGHVSGTTAVTKADITGLGIPGSDTNTWRGVQDNLTSTAKDQSLSANQGKVLKGLIDGKLDASHANTTHLTIGTGAGNAAAGNHTHKYAGSSSAGGAATSANKVNNNLVVKLDSGTIEGTNQFTFNGSAGKTINITPSAVGLSGLSSYSSMLCYEGSGYDAGGSRVSLGCDNTVTGAISIGLGEENKVTGANSLGLGKKNVCTTNNTFMIGIENEVIYSNGTEWAYSFLFGERNKLGFKEGESAGNLATDAEAAYGSVALGQYNQVGYQCGVMGHNNLAKSNSYAIGVNCHACDYSLAIGTYSNALYNKTVAVGHGSNAKGGYYASSFGYCANAVAEYALAIGYDSRATEPHAITVGGRAEEEESLAVGTYSNAYGKCSAALTPHTYAIGENSVCVGYAAETNAKNAIAIGYQTKIGDTGEGVTAMGHFNKTAVTGCSAGTTGTALVIGNGASDNARSNACRITFAGAVIGKAAYQSSGADYAEYFEWLDGNTDNEDRRGYFVTMDGNKIKKAKEGDYILGVVSAYPAVIGNNDMEWSGKFLLDEFGDPIKKVQKTIIKEHELIKDVHFTDEEMQTLTYEERKQREMKEVEKEVECEYFVLNPDFDPDREYVHRADRPEWDTIGMLGVLTVYDDGTCQVNGFCKCNNDGIATACERGFDTYRVIGRVNENLIKVVFK